MNQKLMEHPHSTKMMWGCSALIAVVAIIALATSPAVLLFLVPCAVMMGGMAWMMMSGMRDERK